MKFMVRSAFGELGLYQESLFTPQAFSALKWQFTASCYGSPLCSEAKTIHLTLNHNK